MERSSVSQGNWTAGSRGQYAESRVVCFNFTIKIIAVFSEKTDVPHLPNQPMVAISVMKLWPCNLGQGHQNLISYWSCPIYIGLQIW